MSEIIKIVNKLTALCGMVLLFTTFGFGQNTANLPTDKEILEKVETYMKATETVDGFSGSVLIARNGQPIVNKGYGMANIELNVPNKAETVFRLGSVTKQFTGMAITMLQEKGKLSVNDPLCKFIENCPAIWQPITIKHLLTHTSGLFNYTAFPDFAKTTVLPINSPQMIALLKDKPLDFPVGEKYSYSNSGYFFLGTIIEKVSGKTYADFLQENIFTPLNMKNTGYDDPLRIINNRAAGYTKQGGKFLNAAYMDMSVPFAAGAMYSNTGDLLLWDQALYTEKLVSRKTLDEIFTPVKRDYSYGWIIEKKFNRNSTGHSGSFNGFSSFILRFPDENLTVIILSNSDEASATKVANSLAAIVFGEKYTLPLPKISDVLAAKIVRKGVASALSSYRELKKNQTDKYDFREQWLDSLGWDLIENKRITDAIEIFKLVIQDFPNSANAYDSLGEAYLENKQYDLALANFKKFLELDAKNEHAKEMIKKVEGILR